jgi:hypothetical protein
VATVAMCRALVSESVRPAPDLGMACACTPGPDLGSAGTQGVVAAPAEVVQP